MFKTLLVKEWKEKAPVAVFGLGLMALFTAVFLIVGGDRDLAELVPAGFLIVFFPFLGLMLGAGAFEHEFRNGSWAFLLSRPVRKETVWLAKLAAPLSILAAFWLAFIGLMAAVPSIGEVVNGFKLPGFFQAGIDFFPLVLLSSVHYFAVAFAISILSDRQLGLVFGALFAGSILQGVLAFLAFLMEGRGYLSTKGQYPWLDAYVLALVLSILAFLAASLLTFRRADFSQPRKKAVSLAAHAAVLIALAWALAGTWPHVRPDPKEHLNDSITVVGSDAFITTTTGFYRYDLARGRLRKLAGWRFASGWNVTRGGKVLYRTGPNPWEDPALRVMNIDGSGKRLLALPEGAGTPEWGDFALSPDGKTALFFSEERRGSPPQSRKISLWSVGTDGSGLRKLPPLDAGLAGTGEEFPSIRIMGWLEAPERILLQARPGAGLPQSLWTYAPGTGEQSRLMESPRYFHCWPSPDGGYVLIIAKPQRSGPIEAILLDVAKGESAPVMKVEHEAGSIYSAYTQVVWSTGGEHVAFLVRRGRGAYAPAIYVLKDRRVILPKEGVLTRPASLATGLTWTAAGGKLVFGVGEDRNLRVLGLDLATERTIPVPESVGRGILIYGAGDAVLVHDYKNEDIWRLDLRTEKWKKIW